MYLSRLEMVGFKSFGQKIDLSFNDGVTAIVGPNGCGKTNIVDAIRWVLGEQKTSMLRADSMDQVIFNGSKTRKPLGMAEVSLTIENNKGILPTEYSQVVIARRLFRSGESQYLLNKTQCRLRDIVDLFMDTGMGSDAYSVIELKMIETILSDKAEERRHLFEEAAGVTKYKARRKEAQRKLDAAQRDIARVQDIVREVQKTVNSLARQAEKARQHQELSTRLRELDRLLFAFEYAEEYVVLKQLEARVAEIRARREAAEGAVTEAEGSVMAAETEHQKREEELRAILDMESSVRTASSEVQQQVSLLQERAASATRAVERLEREQHESANQQVSTEEELRNVRERLEGIRAELEQATVLAEQTRARVADASEIVQSVRGELTLRRDAITVARQHAAEQRSKADRLRVQADGAQRRLAETEARSQHAAERLRQADVQIATEAAEMPNLDAALQEAEQRLHMAEERERTLRSEQEHLQKDSEEVRTIHAHSKASLEFLVGLVDTTESSKFLLNTPEWTPSGEKLTLAEIINTDERYRVAIEAALGEAGRYFVVANRDEARQAIAALSRNNVGKATFLCRDAIPPLAEPGPLPDDAGIFGWASELIASDEQLKRAVRGIVGDTVVVNTIDDAWRAMSATTAHSAVTLSGEIVHKAGAVRGGSTSRTEGVRVGRRERIEQLRAELVRLEQRLEDIDARMRDVKSELGTIDLRRLGEEVRRAALVRNDRQQRIDALQVRIADMQQQQDAVHAEMEKFRTEMQELRDGAGEAEEQFAEGSQKVQGLEEDLRGVQEAQFEAEHQMEAATAEQRAAEIALVRQDGERRSLEANEARLDTQSSNIDQRREQREHERVALHEQILQLQADREHMVEQGAKLSARLAEVRAERESLELTVRECSALFHAAGDTVRMRRKELDAATADLHETDLKFNEVRLRMQSLVRRATEELDMPEPGEPQVPETDQTPDTVRTQVQELRRKLTSMGNVNFLALEEHERENERLQFLTQQLNDLVTSERTLQETIAQINQTARDHFSRTFVSIRENFINLFKMLFSEDDEADLLMVDDDDPLECKIDIIAKPRGKRPHSIEMLSGGEKTLTAIALLFAIYLVKPSPFCILDEVDAPLDDANIDRYLRLIRKFAENTQFMMITHNKKTMEAADTLYGVTMEEPAVSKVVSVRLAGERNAA